MTEFVFQNLITIVNNDHIMLFCHQQFVKSDWDAKTLLTNEYKIIIRHLSDTWPNQKVLFEEASVHFQEMQCIRIGLFYSYFVTFIGLFKTTKRNYFRVNLSLKFIYMHTTAVGRETATHFHYFKLFLLIQVLICFPLHKRFSILWYGVMII